MTKHQLSVGATTLVLGAALGFLVWPEGTSSSRKGSESASAHGSLDLDPGSLASGESRDGRANAALRGKDKPARTAASSSSSTAGKDDHDRNRVLAPRPPLVVRSSRPGTSDLYSGGKFLGHLPPGLGQNVPSDLKASQLERSEDVAEKRGTVVGAILSVNAQTIAGWAYAWDDVQAPVNVDLYADGVFLGTLLASNARTDMAQDPGNPVTSRGWACPMPKTLLDGDKHWISALGYKQGSGSKRALDNSPCEYGGTQWPQGVLLWVTPNMAYGWATDPGNPGAPVSIQILGDGKVLGSVTTLGAGKNDQVFKQALGLAPAQKSVIVLDSVSGPQDPALGTAIATKAQTIAQGNRYFDVRPLATIDPTTFAWDEFDFVAQPQGQSPTPLTGTERAGIKFWKPTDDVQAFLFVAQEPIAAGFIQAKVSSADGSLVREAQRSPFPLSSGGNQLPYGAVTFVSNVQISGWAYDPDVGANPIQVDVFVDGAYLQRIPADKTFAALPNFTGIKDPNHAFTFFPPDVYKDGKTHTAQFFAVNQPEGANPELAGSPASFVGQRNAPPVGWLDAGTATIAAGWAYDPDAGANPIQVEIWIDNVLYKTVTASDNRPDLVPIVAPEPTHGYHADVTPALTDGRPHTIRAFALNYPDGPKQELAGSPKELNAQTPWIGAGVQDSSTSGLTVASVDSGSPAQTGGMLQGDVIRSYDGNSLNVGATAFNGWLQTKEIGEQVVFKLYRDPSLFPPAPTPSPAPTPDPQAPPLGPNERLVLVTVGSKGPS